MKLKATLLAGAISALTVVPALALTPTTASYVRPKPSVGTPGPIAGVGLAFILAGGGYLVLRNRKQNPKKPF